ncbi:MAG: hypothetical protein AAF747_08745, partial [Planctomycetota bacterium]
MASNHSTLLVADTHFGKAEAYRKHGVALPVSLLDDSLDRLSRAVRATAAERVIVLGDLLHAPVGTTSSLLEAVAEWRAGFPAQIDVVPGNHDRGLHRAAA